MTEVLTSGFAIGVFAVGVQLLALLAVYGAGTSKGARFYAMAFVLGGCLLIGMVMLDPLAFSLWHIDGMAMCG